jgi:tape measure domain-containing protein
MAEDGKIIYRVVLDDGKFVMEAENAGNRAGSMISSAGDRHSGLFQQAMIGAARRIGEAFVNLAAQGVQGIESIVKAGVSFNSQMETYETAFTTLLGSAEEAQAVMEQIRTDAAATPFDVASLTQATQALVSTGLNADSARQDVLNLANAISATGGGSAELSRMAANMQQIRNTGKATAMDIRQFANAGINIYGLLADSMGVTAEEAAEMDVTYEQLAEALAHAAEAGGMYEGALERQSQTFNGRISTLKDNLQQLAGLMTEGVFSSLSDTYLPMVSGWVSTLTDAVRSGSMDEILEAVEEISSELTTSLLDLGSKLPDLISVGKDIIGAVADGIANGINEKGGGDTFGESVGNLINNFIEEFDFEQLGTDIYEGIKGAVQTAADLLATVNWDEIFSIPGEIIGSAYDRFVEDITPKIETFTEAVNKAVELDEPDNSEFVQGVNGFLDWLESAFTINTDGMEDSLAAATSDMIGVVQTGGTEAGEEYSEALIEAANATLSTGSIAEFDRIYDQKTAEASAKKTGQKSASTLINFVNETVKSEGENAVDWEEVFPEGEAEDAGENAGQAGGYGVANGIYSTSGSVSNASSYLYSVVASALSGLGANAYAWGSDIGSNMAAGINAATSAVTSAVTGMAQSIWSRLHFSEPEIGPLSDFETYAPDMVETFARGISDALPVLNEQLDIMSGDISRSFMPTMDGIEREASVNLTASGSMADMTIVVPLTLDGREIARATAWAMGEQLAWEEM